MLCVSIRSLSIYLYLYLYLYVPCSKIMIMGGIDFDF